jgi:hypothetical protein
MSTIDERLNIPLEGKGRFGTLQEANAAAGEGEFGILTTYACGPFMIARKPRVGDYLNQYGYSDAHPYQIIRMTASGKTAYVRAVSAERDPNWKPEMIPGGFSAHCTNNHSQKWVYGEVYGPVIAVRRNRKGWKSNHGIHYASEKPQRFYDYNF